MQSFKIALGFLTLFGWPQRAAASPQELGRASPYFPLVGLFLGLILALLDRLLDPYLASEILAVLLVAFLVLMSRGVHLMAMGGLFEGLESAAGAERDKPAGRGGATIFAFVAVMMVVVLKISSIEVIGEFRAQTLILTPLMGRWAMVLSAYGADWSDGGMERMWGEHVRGRHLFWATGATLALAVAIGGRIGLWTALWVSLFTLGCKAALQRRLGGLPPGSLGAAVELNEALALVLFASLS